MRLDTNPQMEQWSTQLGVKPLLERAFFDPQA
jgi:hypothetical protein